MRVSEGKSAQKPRFCARGWLPRAQQRPPELSTASHEPCGVHLAAVRQAKNCRNLPRNLPRACRRAYYREQAARLPAAAHTAVALPPRSYRKKATAVCYRRHTCRRTTCRRVCYRNLPPRPTCRGLLPCYGSRAQRAGDSDVGANDKGAGDDPGDGVDAH